jgi:preprotein translocase subunit YajC
MFSSIAYAQETAAAATETVVNPLLQFLPFILIFVVFYFFILRPQRNRQRELQTMADNLKKGDRVVTAGGIIGTVTGVQNDYVVIKTGDSETTKMEVLKSAITGLRTEK